MKPRKPTISEREIVETIGYCYKDGKILIDPRQSPREFLDTIIHEMLHFHFKNLPEKRVIEVANSITKAIWDLRYRRLMK